MSLTSTGPVAAEMERRLRAALEPSYLALVDDSEKHRGHAGHNPDGESHFTLRIQSAAFVGMNRMQRQRAVYAALGALMEGRVHALSIKAVAPGEE